jgi:hypothetical protein
MIQELTTLFQLLRLCVKHVYDNAYVRIGKVSRKLSCGNIQELLWSEKDNYWQ